MNPLFAVGDRVEYIGAPASNLPRGTLGTVVGTRLLATKSGRPMPFVDVEFDGIPGPTGKTFWSTHPSGLLKIPQVGSALAALVTNAAAFAVGDPIEWIGVSRHVLPGARGTITGPAAKGFWVVDFGGMSRNCGENELRKEDFMATASGPDLSRYPGKCLSCGQPAYVGFSSTDCSNATCGARR